MKNSNLDKIVVLVAKTIKGTAFIGMQNYTNKQGEKSNQLVIGGFSYENALMHDFNALKRMQSEVFETLEKSHDKALILTAYTNLFESLEKRLSSDEVKQALREQNDQTIKLSDAQNNAYKTLAKGIRLHIESGEIHVFGLVVRKKVLEPIEYKETKSRELTIVQNKIKKLCEFKQDKIRTFIFGNGETKIQGVTL
jgi:hypothetical protein